MQGIRPQGLQRVEDRDLAAIIATCITTRAERPRSRQLLKHPYFDTIRQEKCAVKLSLQALASGGGQASCELAAEIAGELSAPSISRASSAAASAAAGGPPLCPLPAAVCMYLYALLLPWSYLRAGGRDCLLASSLHPASRAPPALLQVGLPGLCSSWRALYASQFPCA